MPPHCAEKPKWNEIRPMFGNKLRTSNRFHSTMRATFAHRRLFGEQIAPFGASESHCGLKVAQPTAVSIRPRNSVRCFRFLRPRS